MLYLCPLQIYAYIAFWPYVLFYFYPWPYILNVLTPKHEAADDFSITVHVFRNLFWKIFPLFGQILNKKIFWGEIGYWIQCSGRIAILPSTFKNLEVLFFFSFLIGNKSLSIWIFCFKRISFLFRFYGKRKL